MAKKNSKSNRDPSKKRASVSSVSPRNYGDMFKDQAGSASLPTLSNGSKKVKTSSQAVALKGSETVNWEGDYAYVLNDLKWLLILSGALLAVIVAAGFFL